MIANDLNGIVDISQVRILTDDSVHRFERKYTKEELGKMRVIKIEAVKIGDVPKLNVTISAKRA